MNSRMMGLGRESLKRVAHSKWVWLLHVIANAVFMISFFYWTRIPDESGWQFVLTVMTGVLIVFFTLWLHSATFAYFHGNERFASALRRTLPKVPIFVLWSLIFGSVLWMIGRCWEYEAQTGGWLRHLLPGFLRNGISPRTMISLVSAVIWFVFYFVWPIIALPIGAQVSSRGIRGLFSSAAFRPVRSLKFWLMYTICFVLGAYVPYRLAWMTPTETSSLSAQTWSMVVRLGLGYLLLVTAWLVLCAAVGRATEEPNKAVSRKPEPEPIGSTPMV